MQLSIIIVNYNVKYFLEQCLYSVLAAGSEIDMEIFVVDNNSTDGSREWLEPKFPGVKFRWNKTNDGFGKANNSVLKEISGEYILFLNPDTIVPEDCFKNCLKFFQDHPNCGALGVHMIDGSGRFLQESKRSLPSAKFSFFKMSGMANMFPRSGYFAGYYAGHLPEKQNHPVEVLAGAFMMLSRSALKATGGFDENFFMYGEDVDLSYRIGQAGYQNWYFAGTTIIHFKGESTQKLSPEYVRQFYGAMSLFVKKHYAGQKAGLLFLKSSIGLAKTIAQVKRQVVKDSAKNVRNAGPVNTAIVAGQQRFDETLQLIKYADFPVVICGRIKIDTKDTAPAIGKIEKLNELIKQNKIRHVVFCQGEISFKNIIEDLDLLPSGTIALINAKDSGSMVGSNDRNGQGIFMAKPTAS